MHDPIEDTAANVTDTSDRSPKKDAIATVKAIRAFLQEVRDQAEAFRQTDEGKACGREISLLITEAQSARHWAGECLGILDPSSRA